MRLDGKTVLVTGGSQGIGEALCEAFGRKGARVAIVSRTISKGQAVAARITAAGGTAKAFACDVSQASGHPALVAGVADTLGPVDILVNNAGAYTMSPLDDTEEAAVDAMLATNIKALFFLSQAVLPGFVARGGGKIINIGSIFGNTGFPGSSIYCATKGAVHVMTKALALELRDRNVQVNAIAPGWIETPLNEGYRATNEEFMRRADERFGGEGAWMKPDELSGAALFLASAVADSVTGITLFVDRGWSAY